MLGYLFLVIILLWAIALLTGNLFEGFVHLLLVAALVVLMIRYISGKKLGNI